MTLYFVLFQATSKLLTSYPKQQQSEILDYLFKVRHVYYKIDPSNYFLNKILMSKVDPNTERITIYNGCRPIA